MYMRESYHGFLTLRSAAALALACGLLCAGAAAARAQAVDPARDTVGPGGPFEWVLRKSGLTAKPADPKDFVKATRGAAPQDDYLPVGVRPAPREIKIKTPAERAAEEAQLQSAITTHDQISGRVPGGAPKPASAKPASAKPPKPAKPEPAKPAP